MLEIARELGLRAVNVEIRIHAHQNILGEITVGANLLKPMRFGQQFDMHGVHAVLDAPAQLFRRFAGAGENQLARLEPGLERLFGFAKARDLDARRTTRARGGKEGRMRIGLHRIIDMHAARHDFLKRGELGLHRARIIKIKTVAPGSGTRADGIRDFGGQLHGAVGFGSVAGSG